MEETAIWDQEEITCCITGHRNIPTEKRDFVEQELRRMVDEAVRDGYVYFISGFAEGADQIFASIIAEKKLENKALRLEAAIPYRNRLNQLLDGNATQSLLWSCNDIGVHSERYSSGCYLKRNRYMVRKSSRVIAVYDGRDKGGTVQTMRLAGAGGRGVQIIEI